MKAKELMIGDWVFMEEFHKPHKIVKSDFYGTSGSFNEFHPITITEEILKANGFEKPDYGLFRMWDEYDRCILTLRYNSISFFILFHEGKGMKINSVHELQHALRLCGLNELADNFKIK